MTKKKVLSLVELFNGVPMFAKVLDVLESQRFDTPPGRISLAHTILGLMSPLERACSTVLCEADTKIVALGDCKRGHPGLRCLDNIVVELDICPFAKSILAIKPNYPYDTMIYHFMFILIRDRMSVLYPNIEDVILSENFVISTSTKMDPPETIELFQGFEKLSLEEILAMSIKGTFMEQIIDIAESGEFIDDTTAVKDKEVFVREMTPLEKACWTVYSHHYDACKKLFDERTTLWESDAFDCFGTLLSISFGPDDASTEGLYFPRDEHHPAVLRVNQISKELPAMEYKMELLKTLLWNMIISGIPKKTYHQYPNHGIRQGFKIVVYNKG